MHPNYFSLTTSPGSHLHKPELTQLMDEVQQQIHDKTVDLSAVIKSVSREAVSVQYGLMKESNNEAIKLKASQDFLDRNPETSKVQKHQVESFSISSEDARALATAMTRAAEIKLMEHAQQAATGDFVRIPKEDLDADQGLVPEVRQINSSDERGAIGPSRQLAKASFHSAEGSAEGVPASGVDAAQGQGPGPALNPPAISWEEE